ncbi:MAG: hypothetical protein ABIH63_04355 [archaeon]
MKPTKSKKKEEDKEDKIEASKKIYEHPLDRLIKILKGDEVKE